MTCICDKVKSANNISSGKYIYKYQLVCNSQMLMFTSENFSPAVLHVNNKKQNKIEDI